MKCTFISLGLSTDAIGPRILSAILKERGHHTQMVFLPSLDDLKRRVTRKQFHYNQRIIEQLKGLCSSSDLIGLSVMTHHYSTAKNLTQNLRSSSSARIIWGGIHPTLSPEQCLQTADMVCVGEAESSILEVALRLETNQDLLGIPGIWLKQNGVIHENAAGPLTKDLDSLPFPDYGFDDHHLLVEDEIQPMTPENWRQHLLKFFPPLNSDRPGRPAYQILSARGCPYKCSFCGETPLTEGVYGRSYFRKRSVQNVIKELKWAKKTFPFIGEICFCDDTFASRSYAEIQEFAQAYKQEVNLPFYILVSPSNVVRKKFDLLVDAGLTNVGMGIQSGSDRIIELYRRERVGNVKQSLEAAKILNSYKDRLLPYYDFIVENPYESRDDLVATVKLLVNLPRPHKIRVYALSFFPGTPLFDKALADGMFHEDLYDKTFGQRSQVGYLSLIIDMNKYNLPKSILRMLISAPFLSVFNKPSVDRYFMKIHQALKKLSLIFKFNERGLS